MPKGTEIIIKPKIPKRNQISTNTYPDHLSATRQEREEGCPLPGRLLTELPKQRMSSTGPQTKNETHPTLSLFRSDQWPSNAQIRIGSERGFISIRVVLEPMYQQGQLTLIYCSISLRVTNSRSFSSTELWQHSWHSNQATGWTTLDPWVNFQQPQDMSPKASRPV
jgi:hypothetical protein